MDESVDSNARFLKFVCVNIHGNNLRVRRKRLLRKPRHFIPETAAQGQDDIRVLHDEIAGARADGTRHAIVPIVVRIHRVGCNARANYRNAKLFGKMPKLRKRIGVCNPVAAKQNGTLRAAKALQHRANLRCAGLQSSRLRFVCVEVFFLHNRALHVHGNVEPNRPASARERNVNRLVHFHPDGKRIDNHLCVFRHVANGTENIKLLYASSSE